MRMKLLISIVILLILFIGLCGCIDDTESDDNGVEKNLSEYLKIVDSNSYNNEYNNVYVLGLINNTANQQVEFLRLNITLYDDLNNLILSDWTYASPIVIEPNNIACFKKLFQNVTYYDHYTVEIGSFLQHGMLNYKELAIDNVAHLVDKWGFLVTGEIENIGNETLDRVNLNVIFYDSDDKLLNIESDYFLNFSANKIEQFEIYVYGFNIKPEKIERYEFLIDCYI